MTALRHNSADGGDDETIAAVVARIQAKGRATALPTPPTNAVRQLVARVAAETPLSQEEQEAWNRTWADVLDDIRRWNRADDIAEGRDTLE